MSKWLKNFWTHLAGRDSWKRSFDDACTLFQQGRYSAAEQLFAQSLVLAEQSGDTARVFTTLVCMGSCLRALDNFSACQSLLSRAIAIGPSDCPDDDRAYVHRELGVCYYEQGEAEKSAESLTTALQFYSSALQHDTDEVADCCFFLARALILQSRFDLSLAPLERSLQIYNRNSEAHIPEIADTLHCQAVVWNRLARFEDAERNLEKAVPLHEQIFGADSIEVARCITEWSTSILSQGRADEAEALLRRAMQMMLRLDLS